MLTIQINELLDKKEFYQHVVDMLEANPIDRAGINTWMSENLQVFKQKVNLFDQSGSLTISVDMIEYSHDSEEEENEELEEETDDSDLLTFQQLEEIKTEEEELILKSILPEMTKTQNDIGKFYNKIYANVGSAGHHGGVDGSPCAYALSFYIAHLIRILKPGDVGVDFGSGTGETGLTIACLGGFLMILFEVLTFLLLF